jgi:hypothetical protein
MCAWSTGKKRVWLWDQSDCDDIKRCVSDVVGASKTRLGVM